MKSFFHFLRLVRFMNLFVIGLCMWVFHIFINRFFDWQLFSSARRYFAYHLNGLIPEPTFTEKYYLDLNFILLIVSVLLVAAAGNIINDYFDQKADRVNKPERLIVGRHIKRRWAMLFHWTFSSVGTLIAAYLSWVTGNWWLVIISIVCVNILWFYSSIYKRKFLSGNIMIASLIGVVPIYVLAFNQNFVGVEQVDNMDVLFDTSSFVVKVCLMLAGIAFLINLIREFIKDIADIRGDHKLGAKTLPIVLGIKKTKIIISLVSLVLLTSVFLYFNFFVTDYAQFADYSHIRTGSVDSLPIPFFILSVACAFVLIVFALILMIATNQRKRYLMASNILKLAMLFGLISPLFL